MAMDQVLDTASTPEGNIFWFFVRARLTEDVVAHPGDNVPNQVYWFNLIRPEIYDFAYVDYLLGLIDSLESSKTQEGGHFWDFTRTRLYYYRHGKFPTEHSGKVAIPTVHHLTYKRAKKQNGYGVFIVDRDLTFSPGVIGFFAPGKHRVDDEFDRLFLRVVGIYRFGPDYGDPHHVIPPSIKKIDKKFPYDPKDRTKTKNNRAAVVCEGMLEKADLLTLGHRATKQRR